MNFTRRKFLKQSTTLGLLLPFDGVLHAVTMPPNNTYLDLSSAREVTKHSVPTQSQFASILDLSSYSDADPAAIEHLSKKPYDFVILGLAELTPALATAIAKWSDSPFMIFEKLQSLNRVCAQALRSWDANLDLSAARNLSGETVEALVHGSGNLHLAFETVPLTLASILKVHTGSLSLDLSAEPTYGAALELANHEGHELFIYKQRRRPSEAFIDALSSNLEKTVNFERQPIPGDFYYIEHMRR